MKKMLLVVLSMMVSGICYAPFRPKPSPYAHRGKSGGRAGRAGRERMKEYYAKRQSSGFTQGRRITPRS